MQTTKLVSTISYNTPDFLAVKLTALVRSGVIEYAHWIWHNPEDDETKKHAHLILKPNRRLDTSKLRNEFIQPTLDGDKPLCVLPFNTSKMRDWILYAVHEPMYLIRKCQSRKIRYSKENLLTTEPDLLVEHWREANEGEDSRMNQVIQLAEQGVSWEEILRSGFIPINQLLQFRELFFTVYKPQTKRNERGRHE